MGLSLTLTHPLPNSHLTCIQPPPTPHQLAFGIDGNMLPPAVISVVGAAALAAGTTQTLSTALVCLEFTRQQLLLIPVLLAVV